MKNNKRVRAVIMAVLFLVCASVAGLSKTAMDPSKEAQAGNLASAPVPRSDIINAPLVGEVTLTATSGSPAGSFTTLKAAFDAVNAGTHQGVIAISINADTTETASAVLNASGSGAALYTSISIQPAGGGARTRGCSGRSPFVAAVAGALVERSAGRSHAWLARGSGGVRRQLRS